MTGFVPLIMAIVSPSLSRGLSCTFKASVVQRLGHVASCWSDQVNLLFPLTGGFESPEQESCHA